MVEEWKLGNSTLWLLHLEEMPEAEVDRMYACCSKARREAADQIRSGLKRRQSVGAGYLLSLLKKEFFIEEDPVVSKSGKPGFRGEYGPHFNISHSAGYVVLAFGEMPLGVDIEQVRRADLKVAKRFFRKEEYAYLTGKTEAEQADAFCRIWTGKEAVAKALGTGLSLPFDSFSVLGEIVECSGNQYELYRQKITEAGQELWVSVAQMIFSTNNVDTDRKSNV